MLTKKLISRFSAVINDVDKERERGKKHCISATKIIQLKVNRPLHHATSNL